MHDTKMAQNVREIGTQSQNLATATAVGHTAQLGPWYSVSA